MKSDRARMKDSAALPQGAREGRAPGAPVESGAVAAVISAQDPLGSLGSVAGQLVHALRNPISALATSVELLAMSTLDAEATRQLHRVMRNEIAKMNALLEHCRELSVLAPLARAEHDLAALVRERLAAREADFAARNVQHEIVLPERPLLALVDARQLGEALDALITNALEAMLTGGTLRVSLAREGAYAAITVEDSGAGIPAAALPNVFRAFFTTRPGAAGLGLTMAQQIVAAHGGSVEVRSAQGVGTTVILRVPVQ